MKKIIVLFLMAQAFFCAQAFDWALYGVFGHGPFQSGMAEAYSTNNHKHGYIDVSGKLVIPYIYDETGKFYGNFAVVANESGKGIINRRGEYILTPGKYEFYRFDEMPGAYRVSNEETGKNAFFDGNRFITGFEFDYIDFYGNYPFLSLTSKSDNIKLVYNVASQTFFRDTFPMKTGGYYTVVDNNKLLVFDAHGEPVAESKLAKSSKGIEVFRDDASGKLGLRNSASKVVVVPAKYKSAPRYDNPLWLGDVVILYDSVSPTEKYKQFVFDSSGKLILESKPGFNIYVDKQLIEHSDGDYKNPVNYRYYDFKGNEILALRGTIFYEFHDGLYYDDSNHRVYDIKKNLVTGNINYPSVHDGVMEYEDLAKKGRFFKNLSSGNVYGPYESIEDFNEGVAVVTKDGKKMLVNKSGREYTFPSSIDIWGNKVSEGVLLVRDDDAGVYGYVYNPFGHEGWSYNQKSGEISDYAYRNLLDEAQGLFDQKKYATAMNKYYQLMMLRPQEASNFNNYACCLYNLGNYDEALTAIDVSLNYWPDNAYAINLRKDIVSALQSQPQEAEVLQSGGSSYSIWDAIGNFANALAGAAGNMSQNGYNSYYGNGYSSCQASNSAGGTDYQSQYNSWERRAESNYNSLTNLGYSSTSASGKKSGSAGRKVSSGNYVQMKRMLREAQDNMRRIRRKAASAGVTIPQSHWETATVGY